MSFTPPNRPLRRAQKARHRAEVRRSATGHPRRSLVLLIGLVALALAMPTALAVTGKLKGKRVAPRTTSAANLVVNGGFENGTTGWKTNRTAQQIANSPQAARGSASGELSRVRGGTVVVNDKAPTVLNTTAGHSFEVSALVRSSGPDLTGRLRVREVAGRQLATGGKMFEATSSDWSLVRLTYTSVADGSNLDLNVLGFKVPAGASLLVDEVTLVATTGSATETPSASPSVSPSASPSATPSPKPTRGPSATPSATPSPTPSPSATPPAAGGKCVSDPKGIPNPGSTYLGAAVSGGTEVEARERQLGQNLALHRTFYKANQINNAARNATADLAAGRLPWISFKAPHSWEQMASGAGDDWSRELADALAKVPGPVWLAVHHEPENDGNMDAWTQMQRKVAPIIHARTDNVAYSVIYSGWNTFGGDNNTVASKWPGDQHIDILAVDAYNDFGAVRGGREGKKVLDLSTYYAKMAAWATAHGTAWAIGETGQTRKAAAQDPTWLDRTYHAMVDMGGAGLSYFDSTHNSVADWTLDDKVKLDRFRALLRESARLC